ncbi:MAG TPA: SusC/RagA family TonB-linked outer membrane protein [Gemmatimonadales bacterium]|nr:SusC/RagA family TonB-linked outer membrane protein [Gemmatimonadales bacterium]
MKHWILVLAALSVGANARAQNTGRLTGTVTAAEDGRALNGAVVSIVGTNRTAFTNASGVYLVEQVPAGARLVRVRFLGYAPLQQTVTVGADRTDTLNFQMVSAPVQLEGIVATAYGEQERREVTGAITSLNLGELRDVPLPNPAQLIQARVAGVDVVSTGYRPGAPMNVMIRGVRSITAGNQPLYVVDGVPLVGGGIEDFNPAQIASIEVLKDASATAPYGARGANGVILITTNRGAAGASGGTSSFTYDYQYGAQSALHFVDLMNGPELAQERIDAYRLAGRTVSYASIFNPPELNQAYCALNVKTNPTTGLYDTTAAGTSTWQAVHPGCQTGTDWQRSIYRIGSQQQHRVSYNSIAGNARLSLSGTYFNQSGITVGQGFKQYSGTISFENTYGRLRIGATATGSRSVADIGGDSQLWGEATANSSLGLPYDSAGTPYATLCSVCTLKINPSGDALRTNPLREEQGFIHQQISDRLFGSLFAEVTLPFGFAYRANLGPDLQNVSDGMFQGANVVLGSTPIGNSQAGLATREAFRYTLDNMLTWSYTTGEHKVDATGLYTITQTRFQDDSASSKTLPYDYQLWYNLGTGSAPQPPISQYNQTATRSFMGRVNYTYKNRYSLTVTGREDGASVLAAGHKFAFFPSAGLSWQIGDEQFMKQFTFLSGLKLRASLGTTGNSSINPYQTEGSLNQTFYNFGSSTANGYVPGQIPNPTLVWEKTAQLDLGADFGLLRNRISGTVDIYREKTSDLLLTRALPPSSGFASTLQNIGKTGNAGWEFSLTTVNLTGAGGGPRWTTDFSFTHNQNYIISLAGTTGDDLGDRWFIGQPVNIGLSGQSGYDPLHQVFYDYKFIGIWQLADSALARQYGEKPGDPRVADLNGDGKIDGFDREIVGNSYPRLIASIYNRVTWGAFDLSFLLQGRIGYTFIDGFRENTDLFDRYNNLNVQYWTPERCDGGPDPTKYDPPPGETAAQQAAIPGCNVWWAPSAGRQNPPYDDLPSNSLGSASPAYRVGTHWRVRNITLGWTLPQKFVNRVRGVHSARVYVEAQDPWVFTSYYGYDPENGGSSGPPSYRTVLVGMTLGF